MHESYYGLRIAAISVGCRWKWQVLLPIGATVTSNQDYSTSAQAMRQGKAWINGEGAFSALNVWLGELRQRGGIKHQEYGKLLHSVLQITKHR